MNMRASLNSFAFSHSKTAISFNILLVLLILYLRNCRNIYQVFQVSNYNLHDTYMYHQCSSLLLLMVWRYTDKTPTLRKSMNMRASAERASLNIFAFSHSKTAISFNILLVLLILYLRNIYISGLSVSNYNLHDTYIINAVPCSYLWYGVIYTNESIPTKH